jgi:hypothetical protein
VIEEFFDDKKEEFTFHEGKGNVNEIKIAELLSSKQIEQKLNEARKLAELIVVIAFLSSKKNVYLDLVQELGDDYVSCFLEVIGEYLNLDDYEPNDHSQDDIKETDELNNNNTLENEALETQNQLDTDRNDVDEERDKVLNIEEVVVLRKSVAKEFNLNNYTKKLEFKRNSLYITGDLDELQFRLLAKKEKIEATNKNSNNDLDSEYSHSNSDSEEISLSNSKSRRSSGEKSGIFTKSLTKSKKQNSRLI